MGSIPKDYDLLRGYDAKKILKKKYRNWTVSDVIEFLQNVDPDSTVWVSEYVEEADDILIRPVEILGSTGPHEGRSGYVTIG